MPASNLVRCAWLLVGRFKKLKIFERSGAPRPYKPFTIEDLLRAIMQTPRSILLRPSQRRRQPLGCCQNPDRIRANPIDVRALKGGFGELNQKGHGGSKV